MMVWVTPPGEEPHQAEMLAKSKKELNGWKNQQPDITEGACIESTIY